VPSIDCTVLTSKFEGFPMVLVESISQGIPVISSDCPTGPADIVNKDNGVLYSVGNTDQLRLAVQDMVDGKSHFSRESILRTAEKFSSDKYYENVSNALSEMMATL